MYFNNNTLIVSLGPQLIEVASTEWDQCYKIDSYEKLCNGGKWRFDFRNHVSIDLCMGLMERSQSITEGFHPFAVLIADCSKIFQRFILRQFLTFSLHLSLYIIG